MRLSSPPASARRPARGQAGSPAAPGPRGVAAAVKATPSEPASPDVGRRRSLLALGAAGTLLALLPPHPATAALDQAPATIPLPGEGPSPYSLTLPPGWAPATGVSPGGGGGRPTLAWFPPPSSPGAPPSDGASVSLLATPLGADYTQLGSFGDAGGFGANLIASSDQSFRLRGRGGRVASRSTPSPSRRPPWSTPGRRPRPMGRRSTGSTTPSNGRARPPLAPSGRRCPSGPRPTGGATPRSTRSRLRCRRRR